MADPRAFISFDFDNNKTEKDLFAGQAKNYRTPINIEDWSSKSELPQKEWEELIEKKVGKCNMLVVLVGKKSHSATGVKKEIKFAIGKDVPIFGVYVDGANSKTTLPAGLGRSRTVAWKWGDVSDMIDKCMKEGKNK